MIFSTPSLAECEKPLNTLTPNLNRKKHMAENSYVCVFSYTGYHHWTALDHHGMPVGVQGCREGPALHLRLLVAASRQPVQHITRLHVGSRLRARDFLVRLGLRDGCGLRLRARRLDDGCRAHHIHRLHVSTSRSCSLLGCRSSCLEPLCCLLHPGRLRTPRPRLGSRWRSADAPIGHWSWAVLVSHRCSRGTVALWGSRAKKAGMRRHM